MCNRFDPYSQVTWYSTCTDSCMAFNTEQCTIFS